VFVPFGKSNLASFVSVDADATSTDYGTMRVLELPNEQTPGPGQVANTFAADTDVADALAQFNRSGARPVYGNLLTLPVGDALMYVQPVYATRELSDSSFPILTYVLVKYGDEVGIGTTLRDSLADLLGVSGDTTTPPEDNGDNTGNNNGNNNGGHEPGVNQQIRDLLAKAEAAFNAADAALAETPPDTVTWASKTEEGRRYIAQAYALAQQRDDTAEPSSEPSGSPSSSPTAEPSEEPSASSSP
jgi:uncharacterized membrane protein (UPF0182 family)